MNPQTLNVELGAEVCGHGLRSACARTDRKKGCCLALIPLSRSRDVQSTHKYGQTYLSNGLTDQNFTHTVNIGRCVGVGRREIKCWF